MGSVESLMRRAAELEMPALALTDRMSLGGLVALAEAGKRYGVKPIFGLDLPLEVMAGAPELPTAAAEGQDSNAAMAPVITLLAETDLGLRNLLSLHNAAATRCPAHVTRRELAERREGLIALLGGPGSELGDLLGREEAEQVDHWLNSTIGALGRDRVYFEVVDRGEIAERERRARVLAISDFLSIPAVATNDVWHVDSSQAMAHDFLLGRPCNPARWTASLRRRPSTAHFATPREMRERTLHHPELLAHSLAIAERCTASLDLRRRRFPQQDFSRGLDPNSHLWDLVFRMALERLGTLTDAHKERLNLELDHIAQENLANYLLILSELAETLDREGILRGIGEGRITTSLVGHVLGLTGVNPLVHHLPFSGLCDEGQRWPCLGFEVSDRALPEVEKHLRHICGENKIARVSTASAPSAKKLRRMFCEWAGLPPAAVAKAVESWTKRTVSAEEAQRAWERQTPEGEAAPHHIPRPVLAHLAQALVGQRRTPRPMGGQIIVAGEDLTQLIPLLRTAESSLPLTTLDAEALDQMGLLRIEIRPQPAMTIIDLASHWVRTEEKGDFHPDLIPFDDHDTWALIGRGQTTGIPGLERISTKTALRAAKPRSLIELLEVIAPESTTPPEVGEAVALPPIGQAVLAMRCAHLKTHHPVSFMAAMLTQSFSRRRHFRVLLREATAQGIRIYAPDINTSQHEFTQEGTAIRAGLMCVRGMTPEGYDSIDHARRSGVFQDIHHLWEQVSHSVVPITLIENLAKGGVLDSLDADRSRMLARIAQIARGGGRSSEQPLDLFDVPGTSPAFEQIPPETLARHEQRVLGTLLTRDPLSPHADLIRRLHAGSPESIQSADEGDETCVVGFIDHEERCLLAGESEPVNVLDLEGQVVISPGAMSEALTEGEPFLVIGTVGSSGRERFIRAQAVIPLDRVERASKTVSAVALDLTGENRRTVKMLIALCLRHPGETRIEIAAPPEGVSRRLCHRLEQTRVLCSPALVFRLRRILPPESVEVLRSGAAPNPASAHA
jgi:DNA polymerase III alpha subunit